MGKCGPGVGPGGWRRAARGWRGRQPAQTGRGCPPPSAPAPATRDEPLLQLALRRGPVAFTDKVSGRADELDVKVDKPTPSSWLGVPIVAVSRTIGAVAIEGGTNGLDEAALMFTRAVLAQAGIALENARLVELLSSGKREWEQTVDAFNQAICYVDPYGAVRRANRMFAELIKLPVTALPGRPWMTLLPPSWVDPVARLLSPEGAAAPVEVRSGERTLLVTAIPAGEPGASVLLFEDQTEKRRLKDQLLAAHIELTLTFEPGLPEVEVHANQIKQVFVNIINNAAQAITSTPIAKAGGGRIEIATKCEPDGLSVNVSDNGPGIPEAVAQRVFEPFFSTKSEGEGTGLGLSICLGIVKEHGGNISVDPGGAGSGRGATFTVELPTGVRAELSPVAGGAESEPAPAERQERLRVLVVDDEPHILHYMQATLESWGHEVVLAHDGSQALKRALMQPFDLIICDLRMPRLGGREMFYTLARMHPTVADRIIFATGDTVRGDTLQFLEELGRPFLQKPFKLDALRRVLAGVVKVPA